ncbi:transcription repressor NadR [Floccifex sp.]|uniref:transcription repressor NadR n=1 Tax=Floccifex sp. TaxID=2815810 RepID=UPI002A76133A|nr:transcription repressor NadR [Floccifex sp.]MDD7281283.1 transcription repressor NadR [Erysipelotrichaceae bacterium]MDY2957840.1 transcription repressor NadR [Floccifex sp.]
MNGAERRKQIIEYLRQSKDAIPGKSLASMFHVSRQVIVQDIALLRAKDYDIISTSNGYLLNEVSKVSRVFKVNHTDEQTKEELDCIVDCGGCVEDVFVYHRTYGIVRAQLGIHSRKDVEHFLDDLKTGKSTYLKNVTSNYHYHTVSAPSQIVLDLIEQQLKNKNFLAELQDYEPMDISK